MWTASFFPTLKMCDENEAIQQWASESIKIPYRDPLTGKPTIYVPDFLVVFVDNKKSNELTYAYASIYSILFLVAAFIILKYVK